MDQSKTNSYSHLMLFSFAFLSLALILPLTLLVCNRKKQANYLVFDIFTLEILLHYGVENY